MLEKWELVNPIISTFFIKECGLSTIDQAWQLTLESQKENKWSLKNLEKVTTSVVAHGFHFGHNINVLLSEIVAEHTYYLFVNWPRRRQFQGHEGATPNGSVPLAISIPGSSC